jgi:adenylate kinase family enzyme
LGQDSAPKPSIPAFNDRPRRIHVTGGPGSGKTTLARRLGDALAVPVHDLDGIARNFERRGLGLAENLPGAVTQIVTTSDWVCGGAYLGWAVPVFESADLVVWLDVAWPVASYRIVARHIKAELARNNRFPGWRQMYRFWRWSMRYYRDRNAAGLNAYGTPNTRSFLVAELEAYEEKLVACRSNADIERLVSKLRPRP